MNGFSECREVDIIGDCVSGIFETPTKDNIENMLSMIGLINSIVDVLNYKLKIRKYTPIKVGIGAFYGRVLMIEAGYKGSTINEIIYMGEVVNQASKMCGLANETVFNSVFITSVFHQNLSEEQRKWFTQSWTSGYTYYHHATTISLEVQEWLDNKNK